MVTGPKFATVCFLLSSLFQHALALADEPSSSRTAVHGIKVLVDSDLKDQYGEPVIKYKLAQMLDYNNQIFDDHGLPIRRVISSYEYIDTQGLDDSRSLFNGIGKSLKSRVGWGVGQHGYTVFLSKLDSKKVDCAASTLGSAHHNFSVIGLSLMGVCSTNHVLAHELGHADGLMHDGELGGGVCSDSSRSLMAAAASGERKFIMGADNCPAPDNRTSPLQHYRALAKQQISEDIGDVSIGEVALPTGEEFWIQGMRFRGLTVIFEPLYIKEFKRHVSGEYYLTYPKSGGLIEADWVIPLKRVREGLSARLTVEQKHQFMAALGKRKVLWVDDVIE